MKKSILSLGKELEQKEQKEIIGGGRPKYICSSEGPVVVCTLPQICTLGSNGWYCN